MTEVGDGYSTPARVFARAVNESLQPGDKYLSEREIKNQMIKKEFVCKRVGGGQRWLRIRLIGRITDQDAA